LVEYTVVVSREDYIHVWTQKQKVSGLTDYCIIYNAIMCESNTTMRQTHSESNTPKQSQCVRQCERERSCVALRAVWFQWPCVGVANQMQNYFFLFWSTNWFICADYLLLLLPPTSRDIVGNGHIAVWGCAWSAKCGI